MRLFLSAPTARAALAFRENFPKDAEERCQLSLLLRGKRGKAFDADSLAIHDDHLGLDVGRSGRSGVAACEQGQVGPFQRSPQAAQSSGTEPKASRAPSGPYQKNETFCRHIHLARPKSNSTFPAVGNEGAPSAVSDLLRAPTAAGGHRQERQRGHGQQHRTAPHPIRRSSRSALALRPVIPDRTSPGHRWCRRSRRVPPKRRRRW